MSKVLTQHHSLDTPEKQLLRQKIAEILTPEVKHQCSGLVISVHSLDEYYVISNALKEVANRKRKERRKIANIPIQPMTLQIINPTQTINLTQSIN